MTPYTTTGGDIFVIICPHGDVLERCMYGCRRLLKPKTDVAEAVVCTIRGDREKLPAPRNRRERRKRAAELRKAVPR